MHIQAKSLHLWSTSSFGGTTDTLPNELSELGAHMTDCNMRTGRLFAVRCVAETLHSFMTCRLMTTLVAAALLIGVGSILF